MHNYKPFTVTFWLFLYGLIWVLPFGVPEALHMPWQDMHPGSWVLGLCGIYIYTGRIYYEHYRIETGQPGLVSIYIYTQPLLATLVAVLLGTDQLTVIMVLAGLLIFTGVALVSRKPVQKESIQ